MKKNFSLVLILLAFAFPFYLKGQSFTALAIIEEEENTIEEDENISEDAEETDETESHVKNKKKKKNSKAIHLPTAVIGGGDGKQDFTDVILILDREKESIPASISE